VLCRGFDLRWPERLGIAQTAAFLTGITGCTCGEGILPLFPTAGKMPAGPKAGTVSPQSQIENVFVEVESCSRGIWQFYHAY
jgi:hypothetical protein